MTLAVLIVPLPPAPAGFADAGGAGKLPVRRNLPRVEEMLQWLSREQHRDGGWTYRVWLTLRFHLHDDPPPPIYVDAAQRTWPSNLSDTAWAGLALVRAGYRPGLGKYGKNVERAADYLYRAVMASPEDKLAVSPRATAFTMRIGPHADSFLALLFFVELKQAMNDDSGFRYSGAIDRLLKKISKNQRADGSWDDETVGAKHAPLLGHALGVWALESTVRSRTRVDAKMVFRAGRYAMSKEAELREWKRNGKWKTTPLAKRPTWLGNAGVDDSDPVNHELYVMAARLCVLYQADRTNRWRVEHEAARLEAKRGGPTEREVRRLREFAESAKGTRKTLEEARDFIRKTWTKVHKNDLNPSPAPVLFTAEDLLSCTLIVDAMGQQKDVEQWYLHVVQRLMFFQDIDGGLRSTDQHIACRHPTPPDWRWGPDPCYPPFLPWPHEDRPVPMQFCQYQKCWASKDRTFITAAGLMILAAETPYRTAVMALEPKSDPGRSPRSTPARSSAN